MRETKLWTWHLITGAVIFVLLGLHMLTMHLGGLTHYGVSNPSLDPTAVRNVLARDRTVAFTVGYIVLLGAALYHGLYGLRNILRELTLKPATEKLLGGVLVALGLGLFGLGTWAALAARALAFAAKMHGKV